MIQKAVSTISTVRPAVLLLMMITAPVATSVRSAESDLIRQLLQDYDPAVRPVLNPADPVNVTVSLGLKTFITLDMRSQTAVSFGWFKIVWTDMLLTWDPADHDNVTTLHVPKETVWCPDLVIFNTLTDINALNEQPTKVAIRNDGQVLWYPGGLFQTYCTVNITYYPFDTQLCSIDIITWSLPEQFLNGTFADPVFDFLDIFENHPAWDLVNTDAEYELRPTGYWLLKFKILIKRKTMFYIINIILPITLLSSLNSLVFILPAQSGEKMTVSVTSFLSLAVFVSFINEALPQNSDSLCFFSVYVMVQMFLSLCSTAVCALTVSLVHKQQGEASVTPIRSHTASGVLSSPQPRKTESAPSIATSSPFPHVEFPFPRQTLYRNLRAYQNFPLRDLVSDEASSSLPRASCHNSYQRNVSPENNSLCTVSCCTASTQKSKTVKRSMSSGSTPRSSTETGGSGGESVELTQERQSLKDNGSHSRLLALRVDKVFLVTMLSANLVSCLLYTLSMTWVTQHF